MGIQNVPQIGSFTAYLKMLSLFLKVLIQSDK